MNWKKTLCGILLIGATAFGCEKAKIDFTKEKEILLDEKIEYDIKKQSNDNKVVATVHAYSPEANIMYVYDEIDNKQNISFTLYNYSSNGRGNVETTEITDEDLDGKADELFSTRNDRLCYAYPGFTGFSKCTDEELTDAEIILRFAKDKFVDTEEKKEAAINKEEKLKHTVEYYVNDFFLHKETKKGNVYLSHFSGEDCYYLPKLNSKKDEKLEEGYDIKTLTHYDGKKLCFLLHKSLFHRAEYNCYNQLKLHFKKYERVEEGCDGNIQSYYDGKDLCFTEHYPQLGEYAKDKCSKKKVKKARRLMKEWKKDLEFNKQYFNPENVRRFVIRAKTPEMDIQLNYDSKYGTDILFIFKGKKDWFKMEDYNSNNKVQFIYKEGNSYKKLLPNWNLEEASALLLEYQGLLSYEEHLKELEKRRAELEKKMEELK